ncbi:MAG: nucleotidyltransferase family protein [Alphaproteobacteria bacterium]
MNAKPLTAEARLRDAVERIEETRRGIAVVCDENACVIGTITDGDVRRAILRGADLDSRVDEIMNSVPLTAPADASDKDLTALLHDRGLEAVPLVDDSARFRGIAHLRDLVPEARERGGAEDFVAAVIMAGGEGIRLRPITEKIPKPMVEVGGMPLIERHVRHIARAGIGRTFLSVNYLAHLIEEHMGAAGITGTEIGYLREDRKMGTAGALSLLPPLPDGPILVLNSDIVHAADYGSLLAFHESVDAALTVAAIEHRIQIPYGVIWADGDRLTALKEKPSQRFLCNAGIYVVGGEAREHLAADRAIDMTDIIQELDSAGKPVAVFPIHEYWADVGDKEDLARVRKEIWKLDRSNEDIL